MKPARDIPIPDRMRYLPRDKRGYPIPFIVFRDTDGNPHFTINDDVRRAFVIANDRCAICNHHLSRGRWFVGGPASAFDPHGAYIDPPLHHECAEYALQVCPYLAAPSYSKLVDGKTLDMDKAGGPVLLDTNVDNERPDVFVAAMTLGQRFTPDGYIVPKRPFRRIEFWKDGKRLAIRRGDVRKGDVTQAEKLRDFMKGARA